MSTEIHRYPGSIGFRAELQKLPAPIGTNFDINTKFRPAHKLFVWLKSQVVISILTQQI